MTNIVFLDQYTVNGADLSAIKSLGNYQGYEYTELSDVVQRAKEAEILIVNKINLTAEVLESLPRLKLICEAATGVDNIDVDFAHRRGIGVMNAKGYSTNAVAETTLGGVLALLREIVYYDRFVKDGNYSKSPRLFNFDRPTRLLGGRNWGIIGLGSIGHEVARLASAFGCQISYSSVSGNERPEKYTKMELDELLGWADIISIHSPLTDQTRNLISTRELGKMKKSSIVVNVARGGIVDEQALADAINGGVISGAVMDVFSHEPLSPDNPIYSVKDQYRLILSPHNAWSADESIDNLVECIEDNIKSYLAKQ